MAKRDRLPTNSLEDSVLVENPRGSFQRSDANNLTPRVESDFFTENSFFGSVGQSFEESRASGGIASHLLDSYNESNSDSKELTVNELRVEFPDIKWTKPTTESAALEISNRINRLKEIRTKYFNKNTGGFIDTTGEIAGGIVGGLAAEFTDVGNIAAIIGTAAVGRGVGAAVGLGGLGLTTAYRVVAASLVEGALYATTSLGAEKISDETLGGFESDVTFNRLLVETAQNVGFDIGLRYLFSGFNSRRFVNSFLKDSEIKYNNSFNSFVKGIVDGTFDMGKITKKYGKDVDIQGIREWALTIDSDNIIPLAGDVKALKAFSIARRQIENGKDVDLSGVFNRRSKKGEPKTPKVDEETIEIDEPIPNDPDLDSAEVETAKEVDNLNREVDAAVQRVEQQPTPRRKVELNKNKTIEQALIDDTEAVLTAYIDGRLSDADYIEVTRLIEKYDELKETYTALLLEEDFNTGPSNIDPATEVDPRSTRSNTEPEIEPEAKPSRLDEINRTLEEERKAKKSKPLTPKEVEEARRKDLEIDEASLDKDGASTSPDVKPNKAKPVEGKPVEGKPVEGKPVEGKPVESKPVESKLVEGKNTTKNDNFDSLGEDVSFNLKRLNEGVDGPIPVLYNDAIAAINKNLVHGTLEYKTAVKIAIDMAKTDRFYSPYIGKEFSKLSKAVDNYLTGEKNVTKEQVLKHIEEAYKRQNSRMSNNIDQEPIRLNDISAEDLEGVVNSFINCIKG